MWIRTFPHLQSNIAWFIRWNAVGIAGIASESYTRIADFHKRYNIIYVHIDIQQY